MRYARLRNKRLRITQDGDGPLHITAQDYDGTLTAIVADDARIMFRAERSGHIGRSIELRPEHAWFEHFVRDLQATVERHFRRS